MTRADLIALAARVEQAQGPDRCWVWPRKKDHAGRGRVWLDGCLMLAHRAVWTVLRGPIPSGALLCHHCDNPSCVNPAHLYVGDHGQNMADMKSRGRAWATRNPEKARLSGRVFGRMNTWARGERNPKAKLTVEAVDAIRRDTRPTRYVAAEHDVSRTTIQRIRRGALWPALALCAAALRARAEEGNDG